VKIGIDLGGSKIEAVALDDGAELARRRVATPRGDYQATVNAIVSLVTDLETATGVRGTVGVGIPGTISPQTGLVKNANSVWLIGRPLRDDLAGALGREVRIANDANCFATSEAIDGAAAGAAVVFAVIVGTGTGAGIVVRGRTLAGPHGIAGEWGHNPMPWPQPGEWPGPPCYCGKSGCIETFLSGPGLARDYGHPGIAVEDIVRRADAGETAAEAALLRYEQRMARALASIVNVLDPDVIVLGGGLSNVSRLYDNVPRYWGPFVFAASSCAGADPAGSRGEEVRTRLVRAVHGDASGVRGAAWLWNDV
jgi:fructokinase